MFGIRVMSYSGIPHVSTCREFGGVRIYLGMFSYLRRKKRVVL